MVEGVDAEAAGHGRPDEALLHRALEGTLGHVAGEIGGGQETLPCEKTRRCVQGPDRLAAEGYANGVERLREGGHSRSAWEQEDVRHHGEVAAESLMAPSREADAAVGLLIALESRKALGGGSRTIAHGCFSARPPSPWRTAKPCSRLSCIPE